VALERTLVTVSTLAAPIGLAPVSRPELARAVTAVPNDDLGLSGTLRWGLVTGAVGLGLIVIQFLPFRSDEPIALGVILVFAAAGLLTYYARARRPAPPTERGGAV